MEVWWCQVRIRRCEFVAFRQKQWTGTSGPVEFGDDRSARVGGGTTGAAGRGGPPCLTIKYPRELTRTGQAHISSHSTLSRNQTPTFREKHRSSAMLQYNHLTPEEREHFVQHGWLHVPGAIKQQYIDEWMKDIWVRLGWDEHDKSTWTEEYLKMPRHREVPTEEFCPEAWAKMCEIVGGEEKIDPVRERFFGDQFICNFGSEALKGTEYDPRKSGGWHTDNDWYRHFLDSSNNALTIIHCFTDVLPRGGGTQLCEDGMKGECGVWSFPAFLGWSLP